MNLKGGGGMKYVEKKGEPKSTKTTCNYESGGGKR
jgi:hypothetical protein